MYVPVVNKGETTACLYPSHPIGVLSQAQIVSLANGVSAVVQEPSTLIARLSSQDALVNPVREQIRSLDLSALPVLEQDKVRAMLYEREAVLLSRTVIWAAPV